MFLHIFFCMSFVVSLKWSATRQLNDISVMKPAISSYCEKKMKEKNILSLSISISCIDGSVHMMSHPVSSFRFARFEELCIRQCVNA